MQVSRIGLWIAGIAALFTLVVVGFTSHGFTSASLPPDRVPNTGHEECSIRLLEGTFAYTSQGYTLFPPPAQPPQSPTPIGSFAPFAVAGTVTFDGRGNLEGGDTTNFGFGPLPRTFTGTYTVVDPSAKPKQCAFASTFTDSFNNTIHTYAVLANDGRSLKTVNTDVGFVLILDAQKR